MWQSTRLRPASICTLPFPLPLLLLVLARPHTHSLSRRLRACRQTVSAFAFSAPCRLPAGSLPAACSPLQTTQTDTCGLVLCHIAGVGRCEQRYEACRHGTTAVAQNKQIEAVAVEVVLQGKPLLAFPPSSKYLGVHVHHIFLNPSSNRMWCRSAAQTLTQGSEPRLRSRSALGLFKQSIQTQTGGPESFGWVFKHAPNSHKRHNGAAPCMLWQELATTPGWP